VLLQAMACGKPVIATRSNGAADYVSDGTTALLVDAGDRAGLREKIRYLLEHPGAATAMGEAARKKIREEYSGERFGERAYALFQQLVQNAENVQRGTHEEK
jgi:glycosyltransferase involved in cell wall biosynthesis